MNATQTEKQKLANEQLKDAIQNCIDVHYGEGFSLGDYVISTAVQYLNEEGVLVTEHPILFRDGDIPWYRVLGLLTVAEGHAKMGLIEGADNG